MRRNAKLLTDVANLLKAVVAVPRVADYVSMGRDLRDLSLCTRRADRQSLAQRLLGRIRTIRRFGNLVVDEVHGHAALRCVVVPSDVSG